MGAGSESARDYAGHSGAHTPGPWRVEPHDGYIPEEWGVEPIQVVGSDGDIIACNTAFYPTALAAKNARLIAAAPELLDACLAVVDCCASAPPAEIVRRLDAAASLCATAIAKAEGRQS